MIIVRSVASFKSGLDEIVGIAVCKGTELPLPISLKGHSFAEAFCLTNMDLMNLTPAF